MPQVTEIIEEGEIDLGGPFSAIRSRAELLEGGVPAASRWKWTTADGECFSNTVYLQPGDTILVTIGARPDGILTVYFVDFERATSLLWLTAIFVLVILIMSRWKDCVRSSAWRSACL